MPYSRRILSTAAIIIVLAALILPRLYPAAGDESIPNAVNAAYTVNEPAAYDISPSLASMAGIPDANETAWNRPEAGEADMPAKRTFDNCMPSRTSIAGIEASPSSVIVRSRNRGICQLEYMKVNARARA